ncbi:hypothetical protein Tco_0503894 [Tanacetum coccineum]
MSTAICQQLHKSSSVVESGGPPPQFAVSYIAKEISLLSKKLTPPPVMDFLARLDSTIVTYQNASKSKGDILEYHKPKVGLP